MTGGLFFENTAGIKCPFVWELDTYVGPIYDWGGAPVVLCLEDEFQAPFDWGTASDEATGLCCTWEWNMTTPKPVCD